MFPSPADTAQQFLYKLMLYLIMILFNFPDPLHFTDPRFTKWSSLNKWLQKFKVFQESCEHNNRIVRMEDEGEMFISDTTDLAQLFPVNL